MGAEDMSVKDEHENCPFEMWMTPTFMKAKMLDITLEP